MSSKLLLTLFIAVALNAAGIRVLYNPADLDTGPFPSDALTVEDPAQRTGRRVRLPEPLDCNGQRDLCEERRRLNELDGFSPNVRMRVRFSGPINPETLRGVWSLRAEDTGELTGVNQVVWDPETNTAYAKPDKVLRPGTRYVMGIDGVKDTAGDMVEAVSTTFTTMSVSAWMESARGLLEHIPPSYVPANPRTVPVANMAALTYRVQVRTTGLTASLNLPMALLRGVSRMAFGSYTSPRFLNNDQQILVTPTAQQVELPSERTTIQFQAYLPAGDKPASGYPVIIYGHGLSDSRLGGPSAVAAMMSAAGFAVIAINAVGHGGGPDSEVVIRTQDGNTITLPGGGRGVDMNNDTVIDPTEGCILVGTLTNGRDCFRQTAIDQMQLVRLIQSGLDLDGDTQPDLDGDRIYYIGQSLGAIYGTLLAAVEPNIREFAMNSGGGSLLDIARWGPQYRIILLAQMLTHQPILINRLFNYDEDYTLRDQPVHIVSVRGAIPIQDYFETLEWLQAPGDPLSYAPLTAGKDVLWQYAIGDRTVVNPAETALARNAGARERTWVYRHDLARVLAPGIDENPHTYLTGLEAASTALITRLTQQQIAVFFSTGAITDPNQGLGGAFGGIRLFEAPEFFTEELNF